MEITICPVGNVTFTTLQIVLPRKYMSNVLTMAHNFPVSGHAGVRKTQQRILHYFFWPSLYSDVANHCVSCRTCQLVINQT